MHLPDHLGHRIVALAPDEHSSIAVSSDHISVASVGQAGHVLGLVSLVEDSSFPAQSETGLVQLKHCHFMLIVQERNLSSEGASRTENVCLSVCLSVK